MKYLLVAFVALFSTAALADGPVNYRDDGGARFQRISYSSAYERRLRRDYAAFLAEQRRLDRLRAQRRIAARYAALERAERRRVRVSRPSRAERLYRAEEAREAAWLRRQRAAEALERERAQYAAQRRRYAGRDVYEDEVESRYSTATMCKPAVVGYGIPRTLQVRARREARLVWVSQVRQRYSSEYSNPQRAANARYLCDPETSSLGPVWTCKFRAAPCRGEF